jgi:hypothetical protein
MKLKMKSGPSNVVTSGEEKNSLLVLVDSTRVRKETEIDAGGFGGIFWGQEFFLAKKAGTPPSLRTCFQQQHHAVSTPSSPQLYTRKPHLL